MESKDNFLVPMRKRGVLGSLNEDLKEVGVVAGLAMEALEVASTLAIRDQGWSRVLVVVGEVDSNFSVAV